MALLSCSMKEVLRVEKAAIAAVVALNMTIQCQIFEAEAKVMYPILLVTTLIECLV